MKIIFGTTNNRKVIDFRNVCEELGLDIEVFGLEDIGWNLGEILEDGSSIEENSLIKAKAIYNFCLANNIKIPIVTDDSGLFVDYLGGEPGIYTARYGDDELAIDSSLPKYYCVIKLLEKLDGVVNRSASYRCCITCMNSDGSYFQEFGESKGRIAEKIVGQLSKPYFYSVFILNDGDKVFGELKNNELQDTYRYKALKKVLSRINNNS